MIYSIIKKSQLEGAYRFDAEYYQPEYLKLEKDLEKFGNNLKNFEDILETGNSLTGGATPLGANYLEKGIMFLRVQNIMPGYFDLSDVVFIDKNIHEKQLRRSKLINDDVLLTITGVSYGKSAVYKSEIGEANMNQHSVRMHFNNEIIPEYIVMFLNSKYGKFQSDRKVTGDTRPALAYEEIKRYKIPLLKNSDQQKVKKLYDDSLRIDGLSKSLYEQAENLLLEELGLKNFDIDEKLSSVVNFSDVKNVNRMDVEYFQGKYKKLLDRIKDRNVKLLDKAIKIVPAEFNPKKKPDEMFKYVELADVNFSIGTIDGFSEVLGMEAPGRAKRVLKSGDVIVSGVQGSLEKVALVNKDQNGYLASTGFFQFRSDEILSEVLLVLAKSIVFQMQLEKQCSGTILTGVPKEAIKNVIVPILSKNIQRKISDLVKRSFEARKKAKELLEEAKRKVEEMIEKGSK